MDLQRGNPSLRESLQAALAMGCFVGPVNRTGEVVVKHPDGVQKCRVNSRKKDAPKKLVVMLRTLEGDRSKKPNLPAAPVAAAKPKEQAVTGAPLAMSKKHRYVPKQELVDWLRANVMLEAPTANIGERMRRRIYTAGKAELLVDAHGHQYTNHPFLTLVKAVMYEMAHEKVAGPRVIEIPKPEKKPEPTVAQASSGVIAAARAARCMKAGREAVNIILDLAEKGDVASIEAVVELLKEGQP